jgi:ribosomal protein S18 acetylase RimI-like enzyme
MIVYELLNPKNFWKNDKILDEFADLCKDTIAMKMSKPALVSQYLDLRHPGRDVMIVYDGKRMIGGSSSSLYSSVANDFVGTFKDTKIPADTPISHLDLLAVLDDYRGQNIGSSLLQMFEENANRGIQSLLCNIEWNWKFYEKHGYHRVITRIATNGNRRFMYMKSKQPEIDKILSKLRYVYKDV